MLNTFSPENIPASPCPEPDENPRTGYTIPTRTRSSPENISPSSPAPEEKSAENKRRSLRFYIFRPYILPFILFLLLVPFLQNISTLLMLLALLCIPAAFVLLVIGVIRAARKKPYKKSFVAMGITVAASVFLFVGYGILLTADFPGKNARSEDFELSIQTDYDFVVEDGTEPLEVVTSYGLDRSESSVVKPLYLVYDSCDLPALLDDYGATSADCLRAIEESGTIDEDYKPYFTDFVQRIADKYPDAELSILYENLKTLQVIELDRMDFIAKSLSIDSYGCYMRTENTIYIPEGTEYIEGEWGFQVLVHEFCHAIRSLWRETDEETRKFQFCSEYGNTLLEESMNSAFSCSLLNYYERDIAYQVPSNYLRIMLECMDNYDLSDYLCHSDLYFLQKLDEYTGYTNYAQVIWKLITLQRSDWEDSKMDIPAEEYEPIYAYLCDMYYGKYITPDMTDAERNAVAAELVDKAFYDAPEDYKTEPQYFYDYLQNF